jgi:hypothetical protein
MEPAAAIREDEVRALLEELQVKGGLGPLQGKPFPGDGVALAGRQADRDAVATGIDDALQTCKVLRRARPAVLPGAEGVGHLDPLAGEQTVCQ